MLKISDYYLVTNATFTVYSYKCIRVFISYSTVICICHSVRCSSIAYFSFTAFVLKTFFFFLFLIVFFSVCFVYHHVVSHFFVLYTYTLFLSAWHSCLYFRPNLATRIYHCNFSCKRYAIFSLLFHFSAFFSFDTIFVPDIT